MLAQAASGVLVCGLAASWASRSPVGDGEQLAVGAMGEMSSSQYHPVVFVSRGPLCELPASTSTWLAGGVPFEFAQLKDYGCRSLKTAGYDLLEVHFERRRNGFFITYDACGRLFAEGCVEHADILGTEPPDVGLFAQSAALQCARDRRRQGQPPEGI